MREQLTGAAHPALDLVHAQEDPELVAGGAEVAQELELRRADAALALHRLDDDPGRLRPDRVAQGV